MGYSAIDQIAQFGLSSLKVIYYSEQLFRAYHGALERWVTYSHSGMLEVLKTNCTALNISLAGHLIDELVDNI